MSTTTTDRISRAVEILRVGKIRDYENGRYGVQSAKGKPVYSVDAGGNCTCPDYRKTHLPCKHIWAALAPNAAMLVFKLRNCYSLADLRETGEMYAPALADVPLGFVKLARDEYRRCRTRIVCRITFDTILSSIPIATTSTEGRLAA